MEDPPEIEDPPFPPVRIDARGHRCPVPTLRLRRAAEYVRPGERILLLADDPMARIDVPLFVSQQGHLLVQVYEEGEVLHFLIEKG